jgi:hypothetical protein
MASLYGSVAAVAAAINHLLIEVCEKEQFELRMRDLERRR